VVDAGVATLTFSTAFNVTEATDYYISASVANLAGADAVSLDLVPAKVTSAATESGTVTTATHTE
jgi:hypothetical protein